MSIACPPFRQDFDEIDAEQLADKVRSMHVYVYEHTIMYTHAECIGAVKYRRACRYAYLIVVFDSVKRSA